MKHLILTLALFFTHASAQAELGRLFFTPEKRATLSRARALNLTESQIESAPTVTVNGLIRAGNGNTTTWVNNQAIRNAGHAAGMKIQPGPDTTHATLTPIQNIGGGAPRPVKVGETLQLSP